ncbi:response regulator [Chitinophaga eiseniae]|uniref:Response regulator transcription factor n=1 Tax=Chitinophaga eiseniae TaxID=634771 RepID=A0A847SI46_9BACT|nr:response regulator [Chitinophaga eiseniae]NLR78427.1 response regulator transcription factor [Chitinophaga eiseniae]
MRENKILTIEDSDEVRTFIRNQLKGDYEILEAPTGTQGWETAITALPDLIITDVVMPEMDGHELCRNLKKDQRTRHIPVIMLTANTTIEQQLEGLESGANIYLTKPFNIQVLRAYVANLLRLQQTLRQCYSGKIFLEPLAVEIGVVKTNLIEKVTAIIEASIDNADFGISALAKELGMSKAVFYKKFKAITHVSPAELIKSLRLKKAAFLLSSERRNITQVAWEVGFSERKYFSKEFRKYFGISPSEYQTEIKKTRSQHRQ